MKPEISIYVKWPMRIAQLFAILSVFVSILMIYDYFLPSDIYENVTVIKKFKSKSKGAQFYVKAKGKSKTHQDSVDGMFYKEVKVGDIINVEFTKVFHDWRTIQLIRNGKTILTSKAVDIYSGLFISFIFLLPLASFIKRFFLKIDVSLFVFFCFIYGIELLSLIVGLQAYSLHC